MSLASDWNAAGSHAVPNASAPGLRNILSPLHGVASLAALKAITLAEREGMDGIRARVIGGPAQGGWRWKESSALTGDDKLVVTPDGAPATGRWVREQSSLVQLTFAILFSTADAAVLYTLPAGFTLLPLSSAFEVTADFTGGSSSTIGLSSNAAGLSTKGDLLGGAAGDAAATLVAAGATYKGTVGTKMGKPGCILVGGNTLRHDRITSAYTAGAGNTHLWAQVLASP